MAATLNMVKLCVGCDSPTELQDWQSRRFGDDNPRHVTRMWPRREKELLAGGSIYWVFKGMILARQRLIGFDETIGEGGIRRCALSLAPGLVRVTPMPRRPFQGWRYLPAEESPADLAPARAEEPALPIDIAQALAEMGLR